MSFTYEQKVRAVKLVQEEHLSYLRAGREVGASKVTVLGWVKLVEHHGFEALHQRTHTTYSGEFKLQVVEYIHDNQLSCLTNEITSRACFLENRLEYPQTGLR